MRDKTGGSTTPTTGCLLKPASIPVTIPSNEKPSSTQKTSLLSLSDLPKIIKKPVNKRTKIGTGQISFQLSISTMYTGISTSSQLSVEGVADAGGFNAGGFSTGRDIGFPGTLFIVGRRDLNSSEIHVRSVASEVSLSFSGVVCKYFSKRSTCFGGFGLRFVNTNKKQQNK